LKHSDLNRLLKTQALTALLADLETLSGADLALGVYDLQGHPLAGAVTLSTAEVKLKADGAARPLVVYGETLGFLVATGAGHDRLSPHLDAVAGVLTYLMTQALDKRALACETLERYREINLLYRIQEAISARLDLAHIAHLLLQESMRVIKAEGGVLLGIHPDQSEFDVLARHGQTPIQERCSPADTIAYWVVQNQQAAIVNDTSADPRCGPADAGVRSLLCVPLNIGAKTIGVLTLYNKIADAIFTANNQKLLTVLASSVAITIETTREAEAHESQLKAQIRKLRIQIDEIQKESQVDFITATDYFARLQQTAQEMRREFEEGW
jgi:transcriptional regulator with GAF, ATPase, and Fis domain